MQKLRFILLSLFSIALLTTGRAAQSQPVPETQQTDTGCPMVRIDVKRLPDMNTPRADHHTFFLNGEVVVMGGHTTGFIPTPTAEYFSDGEWHQLPMFYTHDQGVAIQLSSGRVMIGGGHLQDLGIGHIHSVEFYDPVSHTFEGHGCLSQKRCFADAVELDNGRVIITGNWYHTDGIELYSGDAVFTDLDTLCVPRACPYVFRTSDDDAFVFSRLDLRGNFVDDIVVESVKGDTIDVPLLREWHPFQVRPTVFRSSDSFIGDTARGEYAYLLPVENAEGELGVALVSGTQFALVPTTCSLPRRSPWGDIFYTASHFITDRQAGRAYLVGKDEHRLYVLCIDYAQALNPHPSTLNSQLSTLNSNPPAPVTLYYAQLLEELGDNTSPVLTPEGDLILAGGMAPDNFVPTAAVWQLCLGQHSHPSPLSSQLSTLNSPWAWGCMAFVAGLILLIVYVRTRGGHRGGQSDTSQEVGAESSDRNESDDSSEPAFEPDFGYGALFERLDALMSDERLFLRPDLKVSDVASQLGTSTRRISSAIKMQRECSFSQYVNTYRVNHAKQLLRTQPDMKISAVCTESGFASTTTFFRTFKALTDMTPTEWIQAGDES